MRFDSVTRLLPLMLFHVLSANALTSKDMIMISSGRIESRSLSAFAAPILSMHPGGPEPKIFMDEYPLPLPSPSTVNIDFVAPVPAQQLAPSVDLDSESPMVPVASTYPSRLYHEDPHKMCVYKIEVQTGNKWGAGTDSKISIRLTNKGSVAEIYVALPDYDNDTDKFEAGNLDVFQEMGKCVVNICRMILYTDHQGWFADWFVESVKVTLSEGAPQETHHYGLHQWLPSNGGPLSILRDDCS